MLKDLCVPTYQSKCFYQRLIKFFDTPNVYEPIPKVIINKYGFLTKKRGLRNPIFSKNRISVLKNK